MFGEIKKVRQEAGAGRRRWFESDGMDLVVWLDAQDAVTGFQVVYDFGQSEQALTWRTGVGFALSNVDPGDDSPLKNRAPVLVTTEGAIPWSAITQAFDEHSGSLEPALRQLVQERLRGQTAGK